MANHRTSSGLAVLPDIDSGGVLQRAEVRERQRFILGPDGSYDVHLNQFLRDLPSWGVRSKNGQDAYCSDLTVVCRFLHEALGGKTIWQMDQADLRAFKSARPFGQDPDDRIAYSTWQRFLAALEKWVRWALDAELLAAEPFRYVDKVVMTPNGPKQVRVNEESEPGKSKVPISFLPYQDFLLWRDVRLRGLLPNGDRDPTWRGRNGERNGLFADLLVCTGMRLVEASCLLLPEIPLLAPARGDFHLSKAVTKRNKPRTVYARLRVLRDVHHYVTIERDELVQRMRLTGAYDAKADSWHVPRSNRHALVVEGQRRAWTYSDIDYEDRLRLVSVDAGGRAVGPLWLWLGEDGSPLKSSTWQSAFRRANERCERFDLDFDVHPHTFRHIVSA
ncbi:site-specific integrase [Streptomyces rishiriensis]|uniref:site-specific integrase n=1 Tax=Streptomyces rishiriensis TaxID=68264 RepID=UPI0037932DDC